MTADGQLARRQDVAVPAAPDRARVAAVLTPSPLDPDPWDCSDRLIRALLAAGHDGALTYVIHGDGGYTVRAELPAGHPAAGGWPAATEDAARSVGLAGTVKGI